MTKRNEDDGDLFSGQVQTGDGRVVGGALSEPLHREDLSRNQIATVEKITSANIAKLIQNAEALIEFTNKIETLALKRTVAEDWVVLGEKPYLTDSGVKKILKVLGSSIFDVRIESEHTTTEAGKRVVYFTASGKIRDCNGEVYENVGTSSSRDSFFAKRKQKKMKDGVPEKGEDGNFIFEDAELAIDDVSIGNVKKKAVTNLHHRLIDCVINIRPTIEKLKTLGIEPKSSVSYGKGTKGGTTDTAGEAKDRVELRSILEKASRETGKDLTALTREVTAFNNFKGNDNPESISTKALPIALRKAKDLFGAAPVAPEAAGTNGNGSSAAPKTEGKTNGKTETKPPSGASGNDDNRFPPNYGKF